MAFQSGAWMGCCTIRSRAPGAGWRARAWTTPCTQWRLGHSHTAQTPRLRQTLSSTLPQLPQLALAQTVLSDMCGDGLAPEQKMSFYSDGHNKTFANNKLPVCINNTCTIFGQIFRAVSKKSSAPYLRNLLRLKWAKLLKNKYFYEKVVSTCWTGKCKLFCWWLGGTFIIWWQNELKTTMLYNKWNALSI